MPRIINANESPLKPTWCDWLIILALKKGRVLKKLGTTWSRKFRWPYSVRCFRKGRKNGIILVMEFMWRAGAYTAIVWAIIGVCGPGCQFQAFSLCCHCPTAWYKSIFIYAYIKTDYWKMPFTNILHLGICVFINTPADIYSECHVPSPGFIILNAACTK